MSLEDRVITLGQLITFVESESPERVLKNYVLPVLIRTLAVDVLFTEDEGNKGRFGANYLHDYPLELTLLEARQILSALQKINILDFFKIVHQVDAELDSLATDNELANEEQLTYVS